jgi:glycosyltransferase involved in cell wall biosynthesis
MRVSVVVRTYNEALHIERLMLGIGAQTLVPAEVIVVDSGSTDDTVAIARGHGARVIEISPLEFTFGRALNRGCAAASGDVCAFASGHVYPLRSTWLESLVGPLADSRVALSYGRQSGAEDTKFSEHRVFAQWFPAESKIPHSGFFCNNGNCAIRRSAWEAAPYDESLPGLEDLAWAKAAQQRGDWIAYTADAEVAHVHTETWAQIRNRYRREAMALRTIDDRARFSLLDFVRLMTRNVVADARAALVHGVLHRELASILMFRYCQFKGTYRGFNGPSELTVQLRERFYYPAGHRLRRQADGAGDTRLDYAALRAARQVIETEGQAVRHLQEQ